MASWVSLFPRYTPHSLAIQYLLLLTHERREWEPLTTPDPPLTCEKKNIWAAQMGGELCVRAQHRVGALLPCMCLHIANGGVGPVPMAALHRSMTAQQVRTHERSHVLHTPPHSRKPSRAPTCNEQQLATRRTRRADGGRDRRCARRRSSIFLADAIRHSSDTVLQ